MKKTTQYVKARSLEEAQRKAERGEFCSFLEGAATLTGVNVYPVEVEIACIEVRGRINK